MGGFEGYLTSRVTHHLRNFDLLHVCGSEFMLKKNTLGRSHLHVYHLVNDWRERKLVIVKLQPSAPFIIEGTNRIFSNNRPPWNRLNPAVTFWASRLPSSGSASPPPTPPKFHNCHQNNMVQHERNVCNVAVSLFYCLGLDWYYEYKVVVPYGLKSSCRNFCCSFCPKQGKLDIIALWNTRPFRSGEKNAYIHTLLYLL